MWKKPIEDARDAVTGFREDANGYLERITTAFERGSDVIDLLAACALFAVSVLMVVQLMRELRNE